MNTTFEKYLDTIDKCLKPLPTSERVDIVKEIKGSILEMESENLSTEQILTRLGKPKDLAKAYLGDLLAKENGYCKTPYLPYGKKRKLSLSSFKNDLFILHLCGNCLFWWFPS